MYTYKSPRPPALISRKFRIDQEFFIVGQVESPVGYRYYNEAAATIEQLLTAAAAEAIENFDLTFEPLINIREPNHTFLPGSVVLQSVDMSLPLVYNYLIVQGDLPFSLNYTEALATYVNDSQTNYRVCFSNRS